VSPLSGFYFVEEFVSPGFAVLHPGLVCVAPVGAGEFRRARAGVQSRCGERVFVAIVLCSLIERSWWSSPGTTISILQFPNT